MLHALENIYNEERLKIISKEKQAFFGGTVELNKEEEKANKLILQRKQLELQQQYENPDKVLTNKHFFKTKSLIEQSAVFEFIKALPKGGCLHIHFLAGVSPDFIINKISYLDNLYGAWIKGIFKLKFFKEKPDTDNWKSLSDLRKENSDFDTWLKEQLSLEVDNPEEASPDTTAVWVKFKKIFSTIYDMVSYKPVFEKFLYEFLKKLNEDNIQYVEIRGTIQSLYDLNDTPYNSSHFFAILEEVEKKFKNDHPNFIGFKYIHSIYRGVENSVLKEAIDMIIDEKKKWPNLIAGIDFVGYEEEGNSLYNYRKELLYARENGLKIFLHAGETSWFGHTDQNLIDAILLNSTRIGHGFALVKHPYLLELVKERNICIDLCPVSNQVLKLIEDQRNHPGAVMLSHNLPVVIGNDDPGYWEASGLSYDWYIVFMAMTLKDSGIEVLKQLALNSIRYSSMNNEEKENALLIWKTQWDSAIENLIK